MSGWKKLLFGVGTGVVGGLLLLAVVETGGWLFLWYPGLLTRLAEDGWLRQAFLAYYRDHDRDVIQFDPICATYDPELFYTLRPGTCRFANREFDTTFRVSSQGFRVVAPEDMPPNIVVVGDSHAMGWGIGEGKTFAELLGKKLAVGVENLAVSSYGTAREMIALRRIQRKVWKVIIVTYSANDRGENEELVRRGFLPIGSEELYDEIVARYQQDRIYYPFKLVSLILRRLVDRREPSNPTLRDNSHEAKLFLDVLALPEFAYLFVGRDVMVMEIERRGQGTGGFIREVAKRYAASSLQDNSRSFTMIDTSRLLDKGDFFMLDGHINEQGHAKIAEAVYERLGEEWKGR